MPCQVKVQVAEYLIVANEQVLFDSHKMLWDIGYRGTLTTVGDPRIDMTKPDSVPVAVSLGDVILYQVSPEPHIVRCLTYDEFIAGFDII